MSKSSLVATTRQTRGFTQGRTAVLMFGVLQGLSVISLFIFAAFVRSSAGRLPTSGSSESTLKPGNKGGADENHRLRIHKPHRPSRPLAGIVPRSRDHRLHPPPA